MHQKQLSRGKVILTEFCPFFLSSMVIFEAFGKRFSDRCKFRPISLIGSILRKAL